MTSLSTDEPTTSANAEIDIDPERTEGGEMSASGEAGLPKRFVNLIIFSAFMAIVGGFIAVKMLTEDSSHTIRLVVGVINALIGSLLSAAGMCCQKWAHNQTKFTQKPATKQAVYWVGLLLLGLGTISAVVNLGILGQAVQSPFAALTLIYNAALAKTVLNETYTRYDLYSTVWIIAGVALAVGGATMSNIESQVYTLDDLLDLYFRDSWFPPFYTVVTIAVILIANGYIKKNKMENTAFGLCHFSVSAGLMAGLTGLAVKSSLEIVKGAFENDTDAGTWGGLTLFILAIPCALVPQLFYMNEGLKHFGTLKFVPLYQCFLILGNMFAGIVYFREMAAYNTISKVLFFFGCSVTLVGVRILLAKVGDDQENTTTQDEEDYVHMEGDSGVC